MIIKLTIFCNHKTNKIKDEKINNQWQGKGKRVNVLMFIFILR